MKINTIRQLIQLAFIFTFTFSQSAYAGLNNQPSNVYKSTAETREIVVKKNSKGIRALDMTNRKHYQLVKSRLRRANMHENKYPQLHRSLNEQRQQQAIKQAAGAAQTVATTNITTAEQSDMLKNAHLFLNMEVVVDDTNEPYLMVRAISSVLGGTDMTYIDLLLETVDWDQIAPMGEAFAHLEGTGEVAASMVSLNSLKQQHPDLEMIVASSFIQTETSDGTIKMALKYTQYPFSWEHIERQYGHLMNTTAKHRPLTTSVVEEAVEEVITDGEFEYRATHPIDGPADANGDPGLKDGKIILCLNRNYADCDYVADQYQVPTAETGVNIPFKGTLTIPNRVDSIVDSAIQDPRVDETTNIYVQMPANGLTANLAYTTNEGVTKTFPDYIDIENIDADNKTTTLSWDIPRNEGRFGNALTFAWYEEVNWYMTFVFEGQTKGRWRTPLPATFQVTLTSDGNGIVNTSKVHTTPGLLKMKFAYSCLAKGTLITMADGSKKPIEQILAGDMVRGALAQNPATAQPMTVADVSIGIETLDMIRIKGSRHSNILVTETHPLSTANRGIIWAKELQKGDRIFTEKGSILVISVTTEQYDDNVYNLKLEHGNNTKGHYLGMFANGLLVGDLATQDEHNYKDQQLRKSPQEVLQRLDAKWKVDYLNHLESKQ